VDAVAGIQSATLLLNENLLANFNEPIFSYEWPATAIDYGLYRITVEVVDTLGNSAKEEINVSLGDRGPTIIDPPPTSGLLIILLGGGAIVVALLLILLPLILKKKKPKSKGSARSGKPTGQPPAGIAQDQQKGAPPIVSSAAPLALQEVSGLNPGAIWPLDKEEVKLGRARADNDIQLQGSTASRRMAIIRKIESAYILHPLHPENPILINKQPVSHQVILKAGDEVQMGESTFLVMAQPSAK
jgi:hypothetical protein